MVECASGGTRVNQYIRRTTMFLEGWQKLNKTFKGGLKGFLCYVLFGFLICVLCYLGFNNMLFLKKIKRYLNQNHVIF